VGKKHDNVIARCPSAIFHPLQNETTDYELRAMFCAMRMQVGESSGVDNGRHNKEVQGNDFCGVILEERLPVLPRCSWGFLWHVP
jgi:hypothetical protein